MKNLLTIAAALSLAAVCGGEARAQYYYPTQPSYPQWGAPYWNGYTTPYWNGYPTGYTPYTPAWPSTGYWPATGYAPSYTPGPVSYRPSGSSILPNSYDDPATRLQKMERIRRMFGNDFAPSGK